MSWASTPAVRRVMQANKRRDTSIEVRIRRSLHARGFRFRVDFAPLNKRRRADIVFTARHLAIFVDGCFWHGCPEHYIAPKANADFWSAKIRANRARDLETDRELIGAGWKVLRIWEHVPPEDAVRAVEVTLNSARKPPSGAGSKHV